MDAFIKRKRSEWIYFCAPELFHGKQLSPECDIWSLGCCILEMATAKLPWADIVKGEKKPIHIIIAKVDTKVPPSWPPLQDL